jgi:virginiamycin A acetyltransferase
MSFRETLKVIARGIARLAIMPMFVSYCARALADKDQAFRSSSQLLSLLPGIFGDYLRREFYRLTLAECAKTAQIGFGTLFSSVAAKVGEHAYIGGYCIIGHADIGRDVLLGSGVHLLSGKHQHGIDDVELPIRCQPRRSERISIGDDTWIGDNATILANVGKKCVVGAGSVVVSDIPECSIAAGNPAKVFAPRERRSGSGGSASW